MDDFGHFRLFPDHQLCPICSTRHHPFCTHSSRFTSDNLRLFPSEIRPPHFERPYYLSHPPPFPAPLPSGPVPFRPSFYPPSFHHEELRERDIFRKRMRVEDQAIGVFPPFETFDRTLSVENERMLNLVRSHGREGISQGHGEHYRNNNIDYRMDRDNIDHDVEQKYIFNRGIDPGFPEPNFHHRKAYSHFNACEGYRNQSMPSLDREDIFMPRERGGFDRVKSETDSRGMFDPEIGDCYPYGQIVQFEKNYPVHGFQRSDKVLGGSEDILSSVQQRSFQKDLLMVSYSSNEDNPVRVGTFQDQQLFQTMPSTSYLLPIASFTSEPCHQEDAIQKEMERKSDFYTQQEEARRTSQNWPPNPSENRRPLDPLAYPIAEQLRLHTNKQSGYAPVAAKANHAMPTSIPDIGHTSQTYPPTPPQSLFADVNPVIGTFIPDQGHSSHTYPPVPSQPLFPIQTELSSPCLHPKSSVSKMISVASPSRVNTSANRHLSSHESQSLPQGELYLVPLVHAPNGFATEGSPFIHQSSSKSDEEQLSVPAKQPLKEKLAYVDASHLFKQPYRASRPDHIVIILRGLPGSGKSYLAKALRDIEVENGGSAPRIHAMDDYFMMEVEKKVDDNDGFKSSGSVRSKKQITKKVIEYCYEPELEEAYRSSMLKAFKKTLDDGIFTLVIVDDRNLRVADFAQFWALSKRPGYEVYLLEAAYKDPVGCAARNIHGFKLDDIQKMAKRWEEAPPLYLHLDIQSLFSGNDLIDQSIQEVDMDADDTTGDGEAHHLEEADGWNSTEQNSLDLENNNGSIKLGKRWNTEEAEVNPEKKDLQKSKWSKNLSANLHDSNNSQENTNALSGLIQTYGKDAKFVHWGDKLETSGFCIGASKKHYASSLIIGPGAGYNLKSNPLPEENIVEEAMGKISNETKKRFSEKLRAESESFRAVFDRRRRRVVGLWDAEDE